MQQRHGCEFCNRTEGGADCPSAAVNAPKVTEALSRVTVTATATRTGAQALNVPASISRIGADDIKDGHALVNISESMGAVPGLLARDLQNYAQDASGRRSSRGVKPA